MEYKEKCIFISAKLKRLEDEPGTYFYQHLKGMNIEKIVNG